jgi:hypothetical protein
VSVQTINRKSVLSGISLSGKEKRAPIHSITDQEAKNSTNTEDVTLFRR